jgi:hypothetical protein
MKIRLTNLNIYAENNSDTSGYCSSSRVSSKPSNQINSTNTNEKCPLVNNNNTSDDITTSSSSSSQSSSIIELNKLTNINGLEMTKSVNKIAANSSYFNADFIDTNAIRRTSKTKLNKLTNNLNFISATNIISNANNCQPVSSRNNTEKIDLINSPSHSPTSRVSHQHPSYNTKFKKINSFLNQLQPQQQQHQQNLSNQHFNSINHVSNHNQSNSSSSSSSTSRLNENDKTDSLFKENSSSNLSSSTSLLLMVQSRKRCPPQPAQSITSFDLHGSSTSKHQTENTMINKENNEICSTIDNSTTDYHLANIKLTKSMLNLNSGDKLTIIKNNIDSVGQVTSLSYRRQSGPFIVSASSQLKLVNAGNSNTQNVHNSSNIAERKSFDPIGEQETLV